jgi:hypothetical protein
MTPPPELHAKIAQMPDSELLDMLNRPEDWIPEALDLSRSELTRRGVDFGAKVMARQACESAEAESKAAESLTNADNASMLVPSFIFSAWSVFKFATPQKGESLGVTLTGVLVLVFLVSLAVTAFRQRRFAAEGYTTKASRCWKVFGYSFAFCLLLAFGLVFFRSL